MRSDNLEATCIWRAKRSRMLRGIVSGERAARRVRRKRVAGRAERGDLRESTSRGRSVKSLACPSPDILNVSVRNIGCVRDAYVACACNEDMCVRYAVVDRFDDVLWCVQAWHNNGSSASLVCAFCAAVARARPGLACVPGGCRLLGHHCRVGGSPCSRPRSSRPSRLCVGVDGCSWVVAERARAPPGVGQASLASRERAAPLPRVG